ncbi:MAG: type II toxin-antitoxin system VapC family toxin [Nitrospirae bacterium]|nr:type II toxin-antitoxin system VapC family toxin [Nitrospirota bacterium]
MKIILDTNEYIFGLDKKSRIEDSFKLFNVVRLLLAEVEDFRLLIPAIIRKEVQRNIPKDMESDFYRFIYSHERIEHYSVMDIPKKLFKKYHDDRGLKEGDALIAAFAEFAGIDYLISENRHIYKNLEIEEFVTMNAREFLDLIERSLK